MTLMWWLRSIRAKLGSSIGLLGQVYPLEWYAAKSNSPGSQDCSGVWTLQWWLFHLNKKLNCCCVYDCSASCMSTNACACCCCVLGFGSPLSLTGTVDVADVDSMMLMLMPWYFCGYLWLFGVTVPKSRSGPTLFRCDITLIFLRDSCALVFIFCKDDFANHIKSFVYHTQVLIPLVLMSTN